MELGGEGARFSREEWEEWGDLDILFCGYGEMGIY